MRHAEIREKDSVAINFSQRKLFFFRDGGAKFLKSARTRLVQDKMNLLLKIILQKGSSLPTVCKQIFLQVFLKLKA